MTDFPYARVMIVRPELPPTVAERLSQVALVEDRDLRSDLLDRRPIEGGSSARRDRDRAAHMLLYLDDPHRVLDLGLEHLVGELGTARGDAGLADPSDQRYLPNAVAGEADPQAVAETPLPNQHPVVRQVWASRSAVGFADAGADRHLGDLGPVFHDLGTTAMLATPIRHQGIGLGLLCVDEIEGRRSWSMANQARVRGFVDRWLGPILIQAGARAARAARSPLTPAERRCVDLQARGLSYIEIARELGKSHRTVDNQLRSARRKLGVRNGLELSRAHGRLSPPFHAPE